MLRVLNDERLFSCSTVRGGSGGGGVGGGGSGGEAEYETIKTRHTLRNNLLRDFMRLGMSCCSVASEEKTSYCWRKVGGTKERGGGSRYL